MLRGWQNRYQETLGPILTAPEKNLAYPQGNSNLASGLQSATRILFTQCTLHAECRGDCPGRSSDQALWG